MLDALGASGALDNTIIIVTRDHGEHLGEHGEFGHGSTLYPQVLRVPLVIAAPGRVPFGQSVTERVTLRDLADTIEHLALGTTTLPGSSLESYWDADSTSFTTAWLGAHAILTTAEPSNERHYATCKRP